MPEPFAERYNDAQRDALAEAYMDRGIRPARRVAELAEAGELLPDLAAFTVHGGANTVRDLARKLKRRRAGDHASALVRSSPADAIDALRRRLLAVAEQEVGRLERQKPGERDLERLRQAARAVREAAAIAPPSQTAARRPGSHQDEHGRQAEAATRAGPAGSLLRAHRTSGADAHTPHTHREETATDDPQQSEELTETRNAGTTTTNNQDDNGDHDPGVWAREQLASAGAGDLVGGEAER